VCVWFPNWPVQRLLHTRRNLRGAVALFDSGKIVASNVADIVGLPVAEVEGVYLEQHDAKADRVMLEQFANWCDQFSPIVGVEFDSLLLDITGLPFDLEQVAKTIGERGFDARLAVAETVGAAWALAHYREPLPVEALRLSADTVTLLKELGIRHVAELRSLPRDRLAVRFPQVIQRLDQFTGILSEPITGHQQQPEIVVERDLEYPLDRHDMVESVLAQVVEQVAAGLSGRQQGAIRVEFVLRCQPTESRIVVGLFHASASPKYLLELLLLQLGHLPGPLVAVRAAVLISAPLVARQRELFDDHHDRRRQLASFVDRISCRSPALRAVLVADAQPEHAFRYEPMAGRKRYPSKQTKPLKRPMLVGPRPIPIEAIATGGAPAQFRFQGEQYRTVRSWGPERIQTGWWRNGYVRRDYYRVQTNRGCYWLFRAQGKWFLHGVFD
jgi:protein ImuB